MRTSWAALLSLLFLLPAPADGAQEKILSFDSQVTVDADGSMTVREDIRVRAAGRKIRRGIYRDFPTVHSAGWLTRTSVGFEVQQVLRDGRPEAHHIVKMGFGRRVYIGSKRVHLRPGEYRYTLVYRTDRQLGFFRDHDELYWNVTGNFWEFPIDRATCTVTLPRDVPRDKLKLNGYTGRIGGKGRFYAADVLADGRVRFETTRRLGHREGLTVVVTWPKGYVSAPSAGAKFLRFIADNVALTFGIAGLAIVFAYFLVAWNRVGRDPEKGIVIPLFEPPEEMSPAGAGYVREMGWDRRCFSAAVINAAVKGYLTIDDDEGEFSLTRDDEEARTKLASEEAAVAVHLLGSRKSIELDNANHATFQETIASMKGSLSKRYEDQLFHLNRAQLAAGVVFSVLTVLLGAGAEYLIGPGIFNWVPVIAIVPAFIILNAVFHHLLKAPTTEGRKIMDQIEGFRMYLSTAEQDALSTAHPPEKTPQLFERYLPYALALDVENEWAEKFTDVLAAATAESGKEYGPHWYHGTSWQTFGSKGFASSLGGSFSSALASASVAPGSSSGSGGGGSSGGGGGGGGGGGW